MNIYIVATPIGNLGDITLRAVETLRNVDIILAEDTRVTIKLLNKYDIKKKLVAFNEHNEKKFLSNFFNNFPNIKNIALVSDAGTPLISDPGKNLVKFAFDNNFKIIPVPGASSVTTLLSVTPFDTTNFIFIGFLDKNLKKRKKQLEEFINLNLPFIFLESPKRISSTVDMLSDINSSVELTIGRELTKKFEEIIYGKILEIKDRLCDNEKGEFIIAVSKHKIEKNIIPEVIFNDINLLKDMNISTKDIATFIVKKYNMKKSYIYDLILNSKGKVF